MADKNFFEQFDTPAAPNGVIITRPNTPKSAAETAIAQARAQYAGQSEAADLATKKQEARLRELQIQQAQLKLQQGDGALPPPPGDVNKTGDEYLATLPRGMAPTIKSVLEGRQAPPSSFALSKPYWQQIMSAANQADPSFDQSQWQARVQVRKQYESQAARSPGAVINSVNTLAAHANSMYKNHLRMAGPNLGPLSGAVAGAIQSWDQKNTPAYNTEISFVQGELQKLVSQGQSNQAEADRILHNLRSAQSFGARTEAIKALVEMAQGKIQPLHDGWTSVMGDLPMPTDITPSSRAVFDNILSERKQALPVDRNGTPIAPLAGQGGPGTGGSAGTPPGGGPPSSPFTSPTAGGGSGGTELATGGTKTVFDQANSALIDRLIRAGATPAQINAALPPGSTSVNPKTVLDAQRYLKDHPGYKGSFGESTHEEPTSLYNRISASAPAAAVMGAVNGATAGFSDEIGAGVGALAGGDYSQIRDDLDARKKALAQAHPFADIIGNVVGGAGALALPGAALARAGVGSAAILAPGAIALDAGYGALYGAGENNHDRLGGAVFGGVLGAGGGVVGRTIGAGGMAFSRSRPGQAVGKWFGDITGRGYTPPVPSLAPAEAAAYSAANKAGIPAIQSQLDEAGRLGVPMSLADTSPPLTSLAGAAVRRSPTAAQVAKTALEPRAAAQVDRFGHAINRDLGATANAPQLSQDLITQARTAAGPLYDRAYAQPTVSTPEIDSLLNTPFGREGLSKARTIMANERVSPTELGISQDAAGNPVMNPQPGAAISRSLLARSELDAAQAAYKLDRSPASIARIERAREEMRQAQLAVSMSPDPSAVASVPGYHTKALDYVKQGMDDVLEQHRDAFGRLNLTPAGRAQNGVKNSLLTEMDRVNPAYRDARAAYAGPMQSRDALALGNDATKMDPQELALGLMGKTPEQMGQVQLGYRSALTGQADSMRYNRNPFDAILGTPNAESRLATVYPNNPGNSNLLRQRDLEAQLAATKNKVLGNSDTAERTIADKAFDLATLPSLGLDAGMIMHGHTPLMTMALLGAKGVKAATQRHGERLSVSKADDLAPLLFNTDPTASAMTLSSIADRQQAYFDAVQASRRKVQVPSGMFGAALGAQGAR